MVTPESISELSDAVRPLGLIHVVGLDRHREWRLDPAGGTTVSTGRLSGVVEVSPADQVVIVRAGTPISELQAELAAIGQTLPYAPFESSDDPSVGGALSLGLPHRLEGVCGTWRDWVLGLTVVRADGSIAKCGSTAVKNVAGYDVGRLFVGGRGALGIVAEVILRTYPLRALPAPACEACSPIEGPRWVQRVRLGDTDQLSGSTVDRSTGTLWSGSDEHLRFEGDWVIRSGLGAENLPPNRYPALLQQAKFQFDPTAKLNPGALGE